MTHDTTLWLAVLGFMLVLAKVLGDLFERVGQPAVLGEILAGVLIGNLPLIGVNALAFVPGDAYFGMLAELGVIVLLFQVGLESNVGQMLRVGVSSFLVALVGVAVPMALGYLVASWLVPGESVFGHIYIGAVLTATSVGITARVLTDLGRVGTTEGQIILGAAVIDDILGLVVLAMVRGMVAGAARPIDVVIIVVKALLFMGGAIVVGGPLSRRLFRVASWLQIRGLLITLSLVVCFMMAAAAGAVGLAAIVGAFAAGLVLDEVSVRPLAGREPVGLEWQVKPIGTFLIPVFFVVTGAKVDLRVFADTRTLGLAAALTVAAVAGKQVCGLAVVQRHLDRLSIGFGMIPRGEVGLIFAAVGAELGVIDAHTNGAIIVMVFLTTLLTPPVLSWSLRRRPAAS